MRDIAAINGPWQAITFLSFYLSEYGKDADVKCSVVLYEVDREMSSICRSILLNYDFIDSIEEYPHLNLLKDKSYDNIWIGKLFTSTCKKIIDSFPQLPIILFEEGMHSYIKETYFSLIVLLSRPGSSLWEKAKTIYHYVFKKKYLKKAYNHLPLASHKKKCKRRYYLLPISEIKEFNCRVTSEYINYVLENAVSVLKPERLPRSNKPRVVVVGQGFSKLNLLSVEAESALYCSILNHYLGKGFDVFWKGHPRNQLFNERINKVFGEKVKTISNNSMPLELVIFLDNSIELCGITSSALMYHSLLFHGKAKHAISLMQNKLNQRCIWYSDFSRMFLFTKKNIQAIEV